MSDLAITAAQVLPGTGARVNKYTAGEAIAAGKPVYLDTVTNTVKLADCDAASPLKATVLGIALNGAATGQPVDIQESGGEITLGADASMVAGTIYILSGTAGGICPDADAATADSITIIGVAKTAAILLLRIVNSAVVK